MAKRNKCLLYLSGFADGLTDITSGDLFYFGRRTLPEIRRLAKEFVA